MFELNSFMDRHGLLLSQIFCLIVVFWVAWPALQSPRMEGDDYRYLYQIQQLSSSHSEGLIDAAIVENRWNHLWFINEDGRIRFFRPTVVASYGMDQMFWGKNYAFGLTFTNVLIHLGCSLLVAFLLHRWLKGGWPPVVASVLFAGLWAHGECIWYIAGRTDSLAALGFLGAFALHITGRLRWWAIPCFVFGLLTKELVVAAPLIFMAYDAWVERLRPQWKLYATYAVATVLVLGLKQVALAGQSSDFVYPYLISPFRPDFMEHLWLQAQSYSANLLLTQWTAPFSDQAAVSELNSIAGVILAAGGLILSAILLRRDGRFWLLLLLGAATWLPTSFVYLSERYLYLPSVAFVGILGLLAASHPAKWRNALSLAIGIYAGFQALELQGKHREICEQPGSVREMAGQLDRVEEQIRPGAKLLLVNMPGTFLRAQFAQETLCVLLDDPNLTVQVLTMMPGQNGTPARPREPLPDMGAGVALLREGENKLVLAGRQNRRVQEYERFPFSWASLESGQGHHATALDAQIFKGGSFGASTIVFTLPAPINQYQILTWEVPDNMGTHPWVRRTNARVRVFSFPPALTSSEKRN